MLAEIQRLIADGRLRAAREALHAISNPVTLGPSELLEYFRLLRRVGAYDLALLRLQRLGIHRPELELERAILVGELGASAEAIRIIESMRDQARDATRVSLFFHLGNLQSIRHRYRASLRAYESMEQAARETGNVLQTKIAQLNVLGTRIYLGGEDALRAAAELSRFDREELAGPAPLLSQGARYFAAIARMGAADAAGARAELDAALELGFIHKMRENLLLRLTRLHLDILQRPDAVEVTELHVLRTDILQQVHVTYFDQLESLAALLASARRDPHALARHRQRLAFGGRDNLHTRFGLGLAAPLAPPFWELGDDGVPVGRDRGALGRRRLRPLDLPAIVSPGGLASLSDVPELFARVLGALARRLEFGMTQGELWEEVWNSPFHFQSSPMAIRQVLKRLRQQGWADALSIHCKGRRIKLELSSRTRWFVATTQG